MKHLCLRGRYGLLASCAAVLLAGAGTSLEAQEGQFREIDRIVAVAKIVKVVEVQTQDGIAGEGAAGADA